LKRDPPGIRGERSEIGAVDEAKPEGQEEGMSTKKKVAASAAIGVAVPAAVGVAKKLLGNDDEDSGGSEQGRSTTRTAGSTARTLTSGTRSRTSGRTSRSARSAGSTSRRSSSSTGGRERTKEQLYNQAKRLNIEGRSKMNKAQLQRAVTRAKS
jgi:hypothetical protein